jgi:molybdopterin-binding protein
MNRWSATIEAVERDQGLALVSCRHRAALFDALLVDDGADWVRPGRPVHLLFKETEVVLAPAARAAWPGSFSVQVVSVRSGKVLTETVLDASGSALVVLLDAKVASALELREGLAVDAWIPPASLALEEGA